jgi:Zn-finger nucleic acid-binding protein
VAALAAARRGVVVQPVAGNKQELRCPKCKSEILLRKRNPKSNVEVDVCSKCHGMWFEDRELEQMVAVASKELGVPHDSTFSVLRCPACSDSLLRRFLYPQTKINVEMCRFCNGLWITKEQLKDIADMREHLKKRGELIEFAPVAGFKGRVIRLVDNTIHWLMNMDD